MNTIKKRIRFSGTLFIRTLSVELRLIMKEAPSEEESTPQNKRDHFFSFYCLNFILSSFICFHLMEVIISANETFDLASGSHFLVNTTGVPSIYFGIIGGQQAEVTYSCLLYQPSCGNRFSVT